MKLIATVESRCFPNCGFISTTKGHGTSPPAFPIHQINNPTLSSSCAAGAAVLTLRPAASWSPQPSLLLLTGPCALRFITYLMQLVPLSYTAQAVPLTGKQEEAVLHGLLLHKALLISSCSGLAGTSALFCRIAGSSSFPVLFWVSLSGYSCAQRTQPAQLPSFLLQDRFPLAERPMPFVTAYSPCLPGWTRGKHFKNTLQLPM